ncbi:hypothetical protein H4S03_006247, partial [Coemansia sp. S3946]
NVATLEYLQLDLTIKLAVALIQRNIFTPTIHLKLQCVMLKTPLGMSLLNKADYSDLIRLMLGIAPEAAVRKISSWSFSQAPLPVLTLSEMHNRLQVLALSGVRMSLWDAMTLIKSLPLLSDFHVKAPTLDPMPAGVTKCSLVKYVSSNYSPMATRFRCWHFGDEDLKHLKDAVKPFLLLALACPNFDYAAAVGKNREKFAELLENGIDMPEKYRFPYDSKKRKEELRGSKDDLAII